jgi:pimeloyl-ACP methyl ester carboxylesterase
MTSCEYYPYLSEAVRDSCFAFFDALDAKVWPIASQQQTVPTAFGPTFVRISGPTGAPPLVLLHGATASSLMWSPNIQALSTSFRTFAVDQVNEFGRSICTKPIRSFDDLLAWLNSLFDALDLRSEVNLVGMSFGGALATQYALHFPARLNKVVLLAPGATVLRCTTEFYARVILAAISSRRWLPSFIRWMFADMARQDPQWIDATIEQLFINMRSLQRRHVHFPPVLTDAEWARLSVPALFLVGEHEVIYSPGKAVRRLKRVAPQVTTEIIPDAGHDLTFAQAALVNRRIVEFLRRGTSQISGACAY